MFDVRFYTQFSKKKNSTKLPSGQYDNCPCELKAPSSIINPTIEISYGPPFDDRDNAATALYTYAYIPAWNRYYFIKDIRYVNRVWEIDLEVDVLASYRTQILNSTKYVLRAQSAQDSSLVDSLRLERNHVKTATRVLNCPWVNISTLYNDDGYFIVGVIGTSGVSIGVINYFAMKPSALAQLRLKMFDVNIYDVPTDTMDESLFKAMLNPSQYIVSIMWLPIVPPLGIEVPIELGWWNTSVVAAKLSAKVMRFNTISIRGTRHPQANSDTHYLNSSPYTTRSLFLPGFGEIPIDTPRSGSLEIQISVCLDCVTGMAQAEIRGCGNDSTETPVTISRVNGQLGVPLPIAQTIQNGGGMLDAIVQRQNAPLSFISGVGNMVGGGLAMLNPITLASGISVVGNGIQMAGSSIIAHENAAVKGMAAMAPTCHSAGAQGSFLEVNSPTSDTTRQILLCETFVDVSETSPSEVGLPLAQNKQISSLTGFCLCANGNIDTGSSKQEKDAIEAYLTSGFYVE